MHALGNAIIAICTLLLLSTSAGTFQTYLNGISSPAGGVPQDSPRAGLSDRPARLYPPHPHHLYKKHKKEHI
jgi:hypothetical protein